MLARLTAILALLVGVSGFAMAGLDAPPVQIDTSQFAKTSDVNAIANTMQATIPVPASAAPPSIGEASVLGTGGGYALANHSHASSIQKAILTTAANGEATWTFSPAYALPPTIQVTVEAASGQPYIALITARTASAVTVKVLRAQTLPSTIALLTALQSFNIFGGTVGAGVTVHIFAAKAP